MQLQKWIHCRWYNVYWSVTIHHNTLLIRIDYVDINECEYSISPCEDVCTNTEGSYTCSCSDNHETVTEDGRCVGK